MHTPQTLVIGLTPIYNITYAHLGAALPAMPEISAVYTHMSICIHRYMRVCIYIHTPCMFAGARGADPEQRAHLYG